jgi:AcrB/AcrD/AcrF family
MSKFFINRPIVAMVISIVMVLVGTLTILSLPIAQFPNITPPEIQVLATYVGADAQTLEQAVATPIEQQMNGVDNMNYMYSLNATGNSTTSLIVDSSRLAFAMFPSVICPWGTKLVIAPHRDSSNCEIISHPRCWKFLAFERYELSANRKLRGDWQYAVHCPRRHERLNRFSLLPGV